MHFLDNLIDFFGSSENALQSIIIDFIQILHRFYTAKKFIF